MAGDETKEIAVIAVIARQSTPAWVPQLSPCAGGPCDPIFTPFGVPAPGTRVPIPDMNGPKIEIPDFVFVG